MFGKCIKNYFSCLRYVFGVLGILFLALLIGSGAFIKGTQSEIRTMTEKLSEATGAADLSVSSVTKAIRDGFNGELTADESGSAIENVDADDNRMISGSEVQTVVVNSITSAVKETVDNYTEYLAEVGTIVSEAITAILSLLAVFVFIQIIGIVVGRGSVLFCARADIEHRNPMHLIIAGSLHQLFIFAVLIFICWVSSLIPIAGVILICLYPILYCIVSLWGANITINKKKRASMKDVLSVKNVLMLFLGNIVEIVISFAIAVGIAYISNAIIAFYLLLSLGIVSAAAVSLNSDTIVYAMMLRKTELDMISDNHGMEIVDLNDPEIEDEPETDAGIDEDE